MSDRERILDLKAKNRDLEEQMEGLEIDLLEALGANAEYEKTMATCPVCGYFYDSTDPRTGYVGTAMACPTCSILETIKDFSKSFLTLGEHFPRKGEICD